MKRSSQLIQYGLIIFISPLFLYFYQPLIVISTLAISCSAIGLVLVATGLFEKRIFNYKLYFLIITIILVLSLIITYFHISSHFYDGNILYDYIAIGIFVLLSMILVYESVNLMKKYYKIISIYENPLKINPKDIVAMNNKGTALVSIHEYQEAMKCFEKVLEIDPKDAAGWYNKGITLEKIGKPQAIKYYDNALKLDPKFEIAKKTGKIILEN